MDCSKAIMTGIKGKYVKQGRYILGIQSLLDFLLFFITKTHQQFFPLLTQCSVSVLGQFDPDQFLPIPLLCSVCQGGNSCRLYNSSSIVERLWWVCTVRVFGQRLEGSWKGEERAEKPQAYHLCLNPTWLQVLPERNDVIPLPSR